MDIERNVEWLVSIPLDLAENLRDYLYELIGERDWWKNEKRCHYQREYKAMVDDIERVSKCINDANAPGQPRLAQTKK